MGLKPREVKMLTMREFDNMLSGYNRRLDRSWDIARTIMADIRNSAFGAQKAVKPTQILKIPSIDNSNRGERVIHIKNKQEAEKLLNTF